MKLNLRVRAKNPYFWIGLGGVVLAAMGIEPSMFTSWQLVWDALVNLVQNPFMLGSVLLAVLGVVTDPTTKGMGDSDQAMTYTAPKQ